MHWFVEMGFFAKQDYKKERQRYSFDNNAGIHLNDCFSEMSYWNRTMKGSPLHFDTQATQLQQDANGLTSRL